MGFYFSSLVTQLLLCLSGLTVCVATQLQAQAAGGDIIISRDVQPRAAARQELVPDPNPHLVNPNRSALINNSIRSGQAPTEISESDFAGVTSGVSLGNGLQIFNQPVDQLGTQMPVRNGLGVSGSTVGGRATGSTGRIGGDINRSVQQGLRPLQSLGK